jgi:hypothetical protein
MNKILLCLLAICFTIITGFAQESAKQNRAAVAPAAGSSAVAGGGTSGQLSKWTGAAGSTTYMLSDSVITEDKFGKIGIGTAAPTSKLTVQGMIETTLGGLKFPDGTVQTTAASGLASVFHDATLKGNGTQGSPLGIALPLSLASDSPTQAVMYVANTSTIFGSGAMLGQSFGGIGLTAVGTQGGVYGQSHNLVGVTGSSDTFIGVYGSSADGEGVSGLSLHSTGVEAISFGQERSDAAIYALGDVSQVGALAGMFIGDVSINGSLSKGGGSFKIDHPLDPENKYLYHSFVESPDMMNIYNGNITTDGDGQAVVELPEWFEALNRDFRYQLTVIGSFAQAMVSEKVKGNRFVIKTNAPNTEVSWQVTGIRHDNWANKNRIPVEEVKTEKERGFYLHPAAFDKAEEQAIEWAHNPERMQQLKQQRVEVEKQRKQQ